MKQIRIGLLGFGTVGAGVARILYENGALIRSRLGAELILKKIADLDVERDRGVPVPEGVLTTDAKAVVDDPEIDIVLEMIGGQSAAKELMLRALEAGKQVITANKALLASQGKALFRAAAQNGVDLFYEASVGGCMPIIKTIRESLVGNRIQAFSGILNGTCNYILTKITKEGVAFETALAEAQARGYAEADPTLDVEGLDTAHKLAILASISYGTEIDLREVYIEGVTRITPMDIELAEQFGYRIKLLAISKIRNAGIEARVHPTMIPCNDMLSNVNGTLNAVKITGDAVGDILLYGHGAGMMPTASAVISDTVEAARNLMRGGAGRVPLLSYQMDEIRKIPVLPVQEIRTHYYFRFSVLDRPGVLSKIAGILGENTISIKSVHQKGRKSEGSVPIVMLTHRAKEADVQKALSEIRGLDIVTAMPVLIRIEDDNNGD